jgi:hypothetical protein
VIGRGCTVGVGGQHGCAKDESAGKRRKSVALCLVARKMYFLEGRTGLRAGRAANPSQTSEKGYDNCMTSADSHVISSREAEGRLSVCTSCCYSFFTGFYLFKQSNAA